MHLKPLPKLILFVAAVVGLVLGYRHLVYSGVIPRPNALKSLIPMKTDDVTAEVLTNPANVKPIDLGTNKPAVPCQDGNTSNCIAGDVQEAEIWAWNANGAMILATGGASTPDGKGIMTSKGSLMAKYGVNLRLVRQDDSNQMKTDLLDTANKLKTDPKASGIKFVTIMGDGGAQFFKDLQKACPTCEFEIVGITGYSRGEDGFWGPATWKTNCDAMKGGLTIGVERDGDWNIAMKKESQCNILNNPDDTVYDPNAMNWVNADSYTKAAEMFVTGTCVDLPTKGKLGGAKVHKCADAVVTWTPGDVTVAKNKGGVVPILTTRQNVFQMPCILVGIKSWDAAHRDDIIHMLQATFEAADQIRTNPDALQRMGEDSAILYKEKDARYWIKYYKGVTEPDAVGVSVPLGGSAVSNLADNLQAFGLSGGPNLLAATYNTFGRYVVQQYPKMYPDFPPIEKILNTSYVQALKQENALPTNNAESFSTANVTSPMKTVEGKKDYSIQFSSGSAAILPSSFTVLNQLAEEIVQTRYVVALYGYTDAAKWAGLSADASADKNQELSQARADAVKAYLTSKCPNTNFRSQGHGQEDPKGDNATEAGRAMNRRVQVVLGSVDIP